jgi:glutathione S-transferase
MALNYASVRVEYREVLLRNKPQAMLDASAKATVPILVLPSGKVIDESIDVMQWALEQKDPDHWWQDELTATAMALVEENDFKFKKQLDHYKYADRYPQQTQLHYRAEAEEFLSQLESRLATQRYLLCEQLSFSDVAIFPFIRQFAYVDKNWFDQAPYPALQSWLKGLLESELFNQVMVKHPAWCETEQPPNVSIQGTHMINSEAYPIGVPGKKWGDEEKTTWLNRQQIKRSYADEVVKKLEPLKQRFKLEQYGSLSISTSSYPLFVVKSQSWDHEKATVLVTGGVHGYETSGVQGAIRFLATEAEKYAAQFNFVVAPCVSPWGYETINRWNPLALDPNRSFRPDSPSEEAAALIQYLSLNSTEFVAHFDLHETTDTDNTEFRPALAARDAVSHDNWDIPDGFYTVGDTDKPAFDFQTAIIKSVEKVTHIAPPASDGKIIGETLEQWGVINYAAKPLGLCMSVSNAKCVTTTEVYPDSPKVDDEICIAAQVAAITGGLEYLNTQ